LPATVQVAGKLFAMIEKILAVGNGARPHHLIRETLAQNLKDQKIVFKGKKLHNEILKRDRANRGALEHPFQKSICGLLTYALVKTARPLKIALCF
jgi:hypothetical protein